MTLLLVLFAGFALGASRPQDQDRQEKTVLPENYFPDGEGRDLIFQGCVQCHDLRNTVSQRKTATRWRRTVNEMIWRGTPLTADEAEIISKYLAASFGPDTPVPEVFKKKSVRNKP